MGNVKEIIVVATEAEEQLVREVFADKYKIIRTGVGFGNAIKKLKDLDKCIKIINIGYAGSNIIPVGSICEVGRCLNYHPNATFDEMEYILPTRINSYTCYTGNDFVLATDIKEPCLFDMELYAILSLGFKNVHSIKIVSDNLSLKEYNKNTNKK